MSAAVLFVVFAVWPLVAFVGALGFAPLAGLAAILTSPVSLPRFRLRFYMAALLAFFAYAAATMLWSPRAAALVSGDFSSGSFAVRSEIIRVGLAILAGGALILVAQKLDDQRRRQLQLVAVIALLLQLVAVVMLTLFERQAIAFFYGARPDDEGVQNISRNSQIMVFAAPFLILGLSAGRRLGVRLAIGSIVVALVAAVVIIRGVDVGVLTLALTGLFATFVSMFKRSGFKLIGVLIAVLILTAPFTGHLLSRGANALTATNSIEYRQAIWQRVIEIIQDNPILGSGVGVLRTHREMIPEGVFANLYYIPNHAHNMLLQLWAETGVVGALLLSIAVVLAGFRLPRPDTLGTGAMRVAAIIGGVVAAWISFDLWNEWWWSVAALLAVLAAGAPREKMPVQQAKASRARGITFGEPASFQGDAENAESATVQSRLPTGSIPRETGPREFEQDARAATSVGSKSNNFNLIRLLLACMVVAYHIAIVGGTKDWSSAVGPLSTAAELGVQGFFVLSGYLVWQSLERSRSLVIYAEKRARRLLPGYAAVIFLSVAGAIAFSAEARSSLAAVARYAGWNLTFLNFMEPRLPGVFTSNPFQEVNGALWTLKIEVLFYLALPLLAWLLRIAGSGRWILMIGVYAAAEAWRMGLQQAGVSQSSPMLIELSRQLPGQMSFFITGIALACWRDGVNWRSALPVVGLALLVLSIVVPHAQLVRALGVGIVVVWLSVGVVRLPDAARFGDLSYGLYIVHFPIIQTIVALGLFATAPWLAIALSVTTSLLAAVLLWHLVEKPALRADSAYRQAVVG